MTHESPVPPSERGSGEPSVPEPGSKGSERSGQVRNNIERLAKTRLQQDSSMHELETRALALHRELNDIIAEEKELRLEKVRINAILRRLRAGVLGLRKSRLQKSTSIAKERSKLAALRNEASPNGQVEIEHLEERVGDLMADIDAFRETLEAHRRDRDRVFRELANMQSTLQDKLTEDVLWKIVALESAKEADGECKGESGVAAELLGRLLMLEKEESQLGGLAERRKSGMQQMDRSGETED